MKTRLISIFAFGLITAATGFTSTWNAAANFNSPSNPNAASVFSYGTGTPGGTFTSLFPGDPSTPGTPSEWLRSSISPCCSTAEVVWNGTGSELDYFTIRQPTNEVRMDPRIQPASSSDSARPKHRSTASAVSSSPSTSSRAA